MIATWAPGRGIEDHVASASIEARKTLNTPDAVQALGALAHEHRLAIYRLLVERGPEGLAAGVIAGRLGIVPSSLTFHLQHLQRAGLIDQSGSAGTYLCRRLRADERVGRIPDENCCGGGRGDCLPCVPPPVAEVTPAHPTPVPGPENAQ